MLNFPLSPHQISVMRTDISSAQHDEPLTEARLRCELWFGCESMVCRVHGCMNANGNQGGAACHPFQHSLH